MRGVAFDDITIDLTGGRRSNRQHDSGELVRQAVDVFASLLADGDTLDVSTSIPVAGLEHLSLVLTTGDGPAGMATATFSAHTRPVATSHLLAGLDVAEERRELERAEQAHHRMLIDAGVLDERDEPGFGLSLAVERPLIATIVWPTAADQPSDDVATIADMETCLAAAWFERHLME